jgi:hypothetical protein
MYEIYIISIIVTVSSFLILKYTCNFLNIPYFIYKFVEFIILIPWYAYIPIIIAAIGFYKIAKLPEYVPSLVIYLYILAIFIIYILAYFISTPQIYM